MIHLTKEELAKELQCSPRTVDNLRARGMPTVLIHTSPLRMSPRFDLKVCKAWIKANQQAQCQAILDSATQVSHKIRRSKEGM